MARKKEEKENNHSKDDLDLFTQDLIDGINQDHKDKIAFNLEKDNDAPTTIKSFISSGSRLLNFIISGDINKGWPEGGRVIECFGPPSIGKSHLCYQLIRSVQNRGGIAIYADCENATSVDNLTNLGINLKRLVYLQPASVEDVFAAAEQTILRAKAMNRDVPVVFIWDSVAASAPQAEIENPYNKETIGLKARSLSKGLRKITATLGTNRVLFFLLNQTREKVGIMFGNPTTTPGGHAIPFHASIRLELSSAGKIENDNKQIIGITARGKTVKNKIIAPHKSCEFDIIFGKGLREDFQIFDVLKNAGDIKVNNFTFSCADAGSWKTLSIETDKKIEEKFRKDEIPNMLKKYENYVNEALQFVLSNKHEVNIDNTSLMDVEAIQSTQKEQEMV